MNPEKKRNFKRLMSPESIAFFGGNVAKSETTSNGGSLGSHKVAF